MIGILDTTPIIVINISYVTKTYSPLTIPADGWNCKWAPLMTGPGPLISVTFP